MHRNIPRSAGAADRGGRLMIAEQDHYEIAIGLLPKIAADRSKVVCNGVDVTWRKIGPVRLP